ncbi:MAG: polyhydroxyalkanoic acid system family protein [Planctomycetia bacterium]|nr:polyhydroxyalkanoic acid system family protein [Planctomycetia bacterium]
MPQMSVTVPHTLSQQDAVERLKGFLGKIKERYQSQVSNLEESWAGDTLNFGFTTFGFPIKGAVNVEAAQVKLDGEIPFAAMMFKGKIEQEIRDQLNKLLA